MERKKVQGNQSGRGKNKQAVRKNGIVGASGSTPLPSTRLTIPKNVEVVELHGEWESIPAVRMKNGAHELYRVLKRKISKRFENGLKNRKRTKRSA